MAKLKCDCGNKEFRMECGEPTTIVDENGKMLYDLQDDNGPYYYCTKCGEEIHEE